MVDDEEDVRAYLKSALEDAGFCVETAVDGLDAEQKLQAGLPDLISLDLVMPKHSGIKFYHDLQKNKKWSKVPVLIVTGHARDDLGKADFDALMMQGPGIYLEKPVKADNYIGKICSLLDIDPPQRSDSTEDNDTEKLKAELMKNLASADKDSLKKALEAMKKQT